MSGLHGKCACGEVEFKFTANSPIAYQCYCSICRRATGSAFSTTILAPESNFIWLLGEEKISSYSKENGYKVNFCSNCGSPVPNRFRNYPLYSVPVGSLVDSDDIKIAVQIYLGSRASWDKDQIEGEQFATMPSLDEMFEMMHVDI